MLVPQGCLQVPQAWGQSAGRLGRLTSYTSWTGDVEGFMGAAMAFTLSPARREGRAAAREAAIGRAPTALSRCVEHTLVAFILGMAPSVIN